VVLCLLHSGAEGDAAPLSGCCWCSTLLVLSETAKSGEEAFLLFSFCLSGTGGGGHFATLRSCCEFDCDWSDVPSFPLSEHVLLVWKLPLAVCHNGCKLLIDLGEEESVMLLLL